MEHLPATQQRKPALTSVQLASRPHACAGPRAARSVRAPLTSCHWWDPPAFAHPPTPGPRLAPLIPRVNGAGTLEAPQPSSQPSSALALAGLLSCPNSCMCSRLPRPARPGPAPPGGSLAGTCESKIRGVSLYMSISACYVCSSGGLTCACLQARASAACPRTPVIGDVSERQQSVRHVLDYEGRPQHACSPQV